MKGLQSIFSALFLILLLGGCAPPASDSLIIFHAGSLTVPFGELIGEFSRVYPGIKVVKEIAGSRTCARNISELKKPCDIMASADYTVIDTLLIPEYADWDLLFATNEMALVYEEKSRKSEEITADNWYEILQLPEISYGRSDPNTDPCGYRAILTMGLAELHYGVLGLQEKLLAKDTRFIRPKETDLLSLLEVHEIDYIFLYRSVAEQHGLPYINLPAEINLGSEKLSDFYKEAKVKISGANPGETVEKQGEPMIYGVTIPKNSPNTSNAKKFILFMLEKGPGIMEKYGQPAINPPVCKNFEMLPGYLKGVVQN